MLAGEGEDVDGPGLLEGFGLCLRHLRPVPGHEGYEEGRAARADAPDRSDEGGFRAGAQGGGRGGASAEAPSLQRARIEEEEAAGRGKGVVDGDFLSREVSSVIASRLAIEEDAQLPGCLGAAGGRRKAGMEEDDAAAEDAPTAAGGTRIGDEDGAEGVGRRGVDARPCGAPRGVEGAQPQEDAPAEAGERAEACAPPGGGDRIDRWDGLGAPEAQEGGGDRPCNREEHSHAADEGQDRGRRGGAGDGEGGEGGGLDGPGEAPGARHPGRSPVRG